MAPRVLSHSCRRMPSGSRGAISCVHGPQDAPLVLAAGADRLRDDDPGDRLQGGDVAAIGDHALVQRARAPTVAKGRARGQGRDDRQYQPDRGVQPAELAIVGERQAQARALHVRPAVGAAVEDPVVCGIDAGGIVGPEPCLARRVHPGMHRRRHEARAVLGKRRVGACDPGVEAPDQRLEVRRGSLVLELDHVGDELVRPAELGAVARDHGAHAREELRRDRTYGERGAVDDHVLELEPVAAESMERPVHAQRSRCATVRSAGRRPDSRRFPFAALSRPTEGNARSSAPKQPSESVTSRA